MKATIFSTLTFFFYFNRRQSHAFHGIPTPMARPLTTSSSSHPTICFLAKTTKKNNKKSSPKSSGGLKGFGGPSKSIDIDVDRSKLALEFYDYLEKGAAGDTLSRCGLGYFPLDDATNDSKLRGVVALKELKKGDAIIRIPYELAINLGQEGADPTIPALNFLRQYCQIMRGDDALESSSLKAYFQMLPGFQGEDCMGSTDFFSEEALDALQAPLIVEETKKRRLQAQSRFELDVDQSFPLWIDGTTVKVEHLQWAVWLITSRVLTVQGGEGEGKSYRLLIPFLDMCNHDRSSGHVLTGRAVPGGELKVVACSTVKEGEQINICYGGGMAGNDRFIQDYGFLDTSDNGKAYTMVAEQMLGKRRIVEGIGAGKLMSEPDVKRTLDALRSTTIEQDEKLLADTADPQLRAAYRYRLGVKKALSKFIILQ